jgi:hypothetical protein
MKKQKKKGEMGELRVEDIEGLEEEANKGKNKEKKNGKDKGNKGEKGNNGDKENGKEKEEMAVVKKKALQEENMMQYGMGHGGRWSLDFKHLGLVQAIGLAAVAEMWEGE